MKNYSTDESKEFQEFARHMNAGKYKEGFEVYTKHPDLIEYITLGTFFTYYSEIKRNIGEKEAQQFLDSGLEAIKESTGLYDAETLLIELFKGRKPK